MEYVGNAEIATANATRYDNLLDAMLVSLSTHGEISWSRYNFFSPTAERIVMQPVNKCILQSRFYLFRSNRIFQRIQSRNVIIGTI